jgi:hypothetical protein
LYLEITSVKKIFAEKTPKGYAMNQKSADPQPEQPAPEVDDLTQNPIPPGSETASAKPEKKQPGRFQRFFRKLLTWLVVLALVFLGGLITDHYLRYLPLQADFQAATAKGELIQVLLDVSNARLALSLNDVVAAKAALLETNQRLDGLLPLIASFDTILAQNLPQRLSLIVSGLERDPETVKIDLELFYKDLLAFKAAQFNH